MTYYLFLAKLHAPHDLRSRLTKWENKSMFCRLHNLLLFLLEQHAVMVQGQDRRQLTGHLHWSAARLRWREVIRQSTLAALEATPEVGLAS